MEPLDILVVEDKTSHVIAAQFQLKPHRLQIARDFNEAQKALGKTKKPYDVVLTDMFFPYGQASACSSDSWQERPLGYAVSLLAARTGVPLIAVVTDCNHHSNAIAATFDAFYSGERYGHAKGVPESEPNVGGRPVIKINNSFFVMFDERDLHSGEDRRVYDNNNEKLISSKEAEKLCEPYTQAFYNRFESVKEWGMALDQMLTLRAK